MKRLLLFTLVTTFSSLLLAMSLPARPSFAANSCTDAHFLTAPAWYNGVAELDSNGSCNVTVEKAGGLKPFIWKIAFNIVEIMLNIVAYVSVGFIIYGGFKYMISAGSQQGVSGAKKTIMNAVIGLLISIMSIGIVNFVSGGLGN